MLPLSFKGGNRSHLDDHDWLGKSGNRVLFELTESPFEEAEEEALAPQLQKRLSFFHISLSLDAMGVVL